MNIKNSIYYTIIFLLFSFSFTALGSVGQGKKKSFRDAQALVEMTVAKYPEIVRLTIHAMPTSKKNSMIIAFNIKKSIF